MCQMGDFLFQWLNMYGLSNCIRQISQTSQKEFQKNLNCLFTPLEGIQMELLFGIGTTCQVLQTCHSSKGLQTI